MRETRLMQFRIHPQVDINSRTDRGYVHLCLR